MDTSDEEYFASFIITFFISPNLCKSSFVVNNAKHLFLPTFDMVTITKNFDDFNLRRDHKKISYERRTYESVDEKSLS